MGLHIFAQNYKVTTLLLANLNQESFSRIYNYMGYISCVIPAAIENGAAAAIPNPVIPPATADPVRPVWVK